MTVEKKSRIDTGVSPRITGSINFVSLVSTQVSTLSNYTTRTVFTRRHRNRGVGFY